MNSEPNTEDPTTKVDAPEDDQRLPDAANLTEKEASELLVNWEVAAATAARLAPPGPALAPKEAQQEVSALRSAATESVAHVHRITGIKAAAGLGEDLSDVLVVDRPGWSQGNLSSFQNLLAPALKTALEKAPKMAKEGSTSQVVGSATAGAELGAVLAFLSANVLGQFDPFHSSDQAPSGRLLLVAPNLVSVAKQLNVDRDDFRLWVCLHEQTHRVQFAAAPWLAEHLLGKITELSTSTMGQADTFPQKLAEAAKSLREELKASKKNETEDDGGPRPRQRLLEAIQSPEDRQIMSHLTAVMSLLEGHANVVMDAVDASIVPTVKTIRRRFEERGKSRSPLEKAIRRLLQLDAKAAQYRDGQKFVDHVVGQIGMEKFNIIWDSPEHLPTEEEIHDPARWMQRMDLD